MLRDLLAGYEVEQLARARSKPVGGPSPLSHKDDAGETTASLESRLHRQISCPVSSRVVYRRARLRTPTIEPASGNAVNRRRQALINRSLESRESEKKWPKPKTIPTAIHGQANTAPSHQSWRPIRRKYQPAPNAKLAPTSVSVTCTTDAKRSGGLADHPGPCKPQKRAKRT